VTVQGGDDSFGGVLDRTPSVVLYRVRSVRAHVVGDAGGIKSAVGQIDMEG